MTYLRDICIILIVTQKRAARKLSNYLKGEHKKMLTVFLALVGLGTMAWTIRLWRRAKQKQQEEETAEA